MDDKIINSKPFDVADYLETDDDIWEFLLEAVATGTSADFIHALNTAVRAKGVTAVAEEVGVSRTSLYKSLSPNGNPRFDTINKIVKALGGNLTISHQ